MRTWIRLGSFQDRFNFFIESKSFAELKGEFMNMFFRQVFKFKVNYLFGFILKHIKSNKLFPCFPKHGSLVGPP